MYDKPRRMISIEPETHVDLRKAWLRYVVENRVMMSLTKFTSHVLKAGMEALAKPGSDK